MGGAARIAGRLDDRHAHRAAPRRPCLACDSGSRRPALVALHDLRHACATFLLASGASPRTVMKTLGHSQIALTMNTYAHVLAEVERAAMDAAAKRIFG
ncbi:tyrosine-type recombinase/integrase [Micromonosporaceae bacterium DT55]|uniref:tyrosine-type recombinase/integrase n=1 Tax=Melissospora conviva TaxID=3388432 RepID=UPI003C22E3F2